MAQLFNTRRRARQSMRLLSTESHTMIDTLRPTAATRPTPAPTNATQPSLVRRALAERLAAWWRAFCMDERTRFLSQATSASELEQRMRQWDDHCVNRSWQHTRF